MLRLTKTQDRIMHALLDAGPGGAGVTEIARAVGLSPPTVFRHLASLREEGLVEKHPGPRVAYRARPHFSALWVDPDHRRLVSWATGARISWRYPLVARVPDEMAQEALLRFLPEVEAVVASRGRRRADGGLEDAAATVIVYGSCARGEARRTSDLDLIVLAREAAKVRSRLLDAAAAASLRAPKTIDLRVLAGDEWARLPLALKEGVRREGLIVFSTSDRLPTMDELAWSEVARPG